MPVISIIGAPGVGKSFLVKQLACLHCMPCFFEGEIGIFTDDVLKVLNGEQDSPQRYVWLLDRFKRNLEAAHKASSAGLTCFVDGDILSVESWLLAENGQFSPTVLYKWLKENQHLRADKTLILVASEEKIKQNMNSRGRAAEMTGFIHERMLRIQNAMKQVAKNHPECVLLDRTNLDFTNPRTLKEVSLILELKI